MTDYLSWLASLDEQQLATLLENRSEVLNGVPPADLSAVASRMSQPPATARALLWQPLPAIQILTALLMAGGSSSVTRCAGLLDGAAGAGADAHVGHVRQWLAHLAAYGLAFVDRQDVAHAAPAVGHVLPLPEDPGSPARALVEAISKDRLAPVLRAWGLPSQPTKAATVDVLTEAFADPARLAGQLELLSGQQRTLLVDLAGPEDYRFQHQWLNQRMDALQAGIAAGVVLAGYSTYDAHVPTEVRIALRDMTFPFDPAQPPLPVTEASQTMVDREGQAALAQFSEACLTVLDHVRDQPVKWSRNLCIGTREVNRVSKATDVGVPLVRLVLECAYAARVVEVDGAHLVCGEVADAWRDLDPGARVILLLEQWPTLPWTATQTHDAAGKALSVHDTDRDCGLCLDGRMTTLAEWVAVEPGSSVDDQSMARIVAWVRPLAHTAHREVVEDPDEWRRPAHARGRGRAARSHPEPFGVLNEGPPTLGAIADEARLLGLVAHGCATDLLRAMLAADRARAVSLAEAMLPAAVAQATFGSDLTAVVTGPPTGELSALLDSCADRESRGGAVTWRFTTASVRRALDAGATAATVTARLAAMAANGLPQPLIYLINDVGRRHGALRVADARAVVRCEDEALLAEVTADRKLRKLGLRLVAPTVVISAFGEAETITALRAAGYLPMPGLNPAPDSDGASSGAGFGARSAADAGETDAGGAVGGADAARPAAGGVVDLAARRAARLQDGGTEAASMQSLQRLIDELEARHGGPLLRASATQTEPEPPDAAAARLVGTTHAPREQGTDPKLVTELRRANRVLSDDEVRILAAAILHDGAVRVRYRSSSGAVTDRIISDLVYSGQLLEAWCHLRNDARTFLASEILSVSFP